MGSTTTFKHKPRIISFKLVKGNGKDRVFEAVNDRAKRVVAKKFNKRKFVTAGQLSTLGNYYRIRQYVDGQLKIVRV
jgi:IS1 family transposase